LPEHTAAVGRLAIDGDYDVAPLDLGRYAPDGDDRTPVDIASGRRGEAGVFGEIVP
jgi:hypothetical protein